MDPGLAPSISRNLVNHAALVDSTKDHDSTASATELGVLVRCRMLLLSVIF